MDIYPPNVFHSFKSLCDYLLLMTCLPSGARLSLWIEFCRLCAIRRLQTSFCWNARGRTRAPNRVLGGWVNHIGQLWNEESFLSRSGRSTIESASIRLRRNRWPRQILWGPRLLIRRPHSVSYIRCARQNRRLGEPFLPILLPGFGNSCKIIVVMHYFVLYLRKSPKISTTSFPCLELSCQVCCWRCLPVAYFLEANRDLDLT